MSFCARRPPVGSRSSPLRTLSSTRSIPAPLASQASGHRTGTASCGLRIFFFARKPSDGAFECLFLKHLHAALPCFLLIGPCLLLLAPCSRRTPTTAPGRPWVCPSRCPGAFPPSSLLNIFKELQADLGARPRDTGTSRTGRSRWAVACHTSQVASRKSPAPSPKLHVAGYEEPPKRASAVSCLPLLRR